MKGRNTNLIARFAEVEAELAEKFFLRSSELAEILGNRMAIKRLVDIGVLKHLGSGYYTSKKVDHFTAKLAIASRQYRNTVIAGETALYMHGLITQAPKKIDVAVKKSQNIQNSIMRTKRFSDRYLKRGVIETVFNGLKLKIYEKECALCMLAGSKRDAEKVKEILQRNHHSLDMEKLRYWDDVWKTNISNYRPSKRNWKSSKDMQALTVEDRVLKVATQLYAYYGLENATLAQIAKEAEVDLNEMRCIFPDKLDLKRAIFERRKQEILQATSFEIEAGLSAIENLKIIVDGMFESVVHVESEWEFRFQIRSLAEQSYFVKEIVQSICNKGIDVIKQLILMNVKGISEREAYVRAAVLLANMDSVIFVRWSYLNYMELPEDRDAFVRRYKCFLADQMVSLMFAPAARAASQDGLYPAN